MSQADTISMHALGHAISALNNRTPHGIAISIIAPETLTYYSENGYEDRMADLAKVVGGTTAKDYITWIEETLKAVDLYYIDIDKYGIDAKNPDKYAENCTVTLAAYHLSDIEPMSRETVKSIYEAAFKRHLSVK